ncbi:ATP-binding protein [Mucilaginibacter sp. PAMB04168]|uniref:PAS domain-containing sensor histidine kinase n=1 Tax=Mucilaginibacter sp. PAMB04168 TaxID=3138567 RepID=UPI0031F6274A
MQVTEQEVFIQVGELSKDVYFIYDIARKEFNYISPAFSAVWGIGAAKAVKNPLVMLNVVHDEDREHVLNCLNDFKNTLKETQFTFRINYDDEAFKHLCVSLYPIKEQGGLTCVAGIAEDITITQQNIFYTEKINARKNSTLEILAHDLKGPLGTISMMASSIKREAQLDLKDKERILQAAMFIQDMCARNIALIRSLVNQEFLESAEVMLRKERADLVWEIRDVIRNYQSAEQHLAKRFILTSRHEKLFIQLDSLKFMQVINNLISNAIKFTPDNGNIEVSIEDNADSVLVTIADNGIGIPSHLQPYLFDKFTRARRPGLRGEEPVGLGMSIIKTIVELHGGDITFDSEEDKGSRFYVKIPKK